MKTFHQLTKEQQLDAVEFAKSELRTAMRLGLITFNKKPTETMIEKWSKEAARGSLYLSNGEAYIPNIGTKVANC